MEPNLGSNQFEVPNQPNETVVPTPTPTPVTQKSSALKIILIIIAVIVGLGILSSVVLGFFVKRFFNSLASGGVESFVENRIKSETGRDVDLDLDASDGTVNINTSEGNFQVNAGTDGQDVVVPEAVKDLVPMMSGAVAKSTMSINGTAESKAGYMTLFVTKASASEVKAYYEKELVAAGWTKETDMVQDASISMVTFKKDDKSVMLTTSGISDDTDFKTGFQLVLAGY